MRRLFAQLFSDPETEVDEKERAEAISLARMVLSFSEHPYFPRLLAYLDVEALRPFDMTDPTKVAISATRANTFREIRHRLDTLVREAQSRVKEAMDA